jgi:hypothetical protein
MTAFNRKVLSIGGIEGDIALPDATLLDLRSGTQLQNFVSSPELLSLLHTCKSGARGTPESPGEVGETCPQPRVLRGAPLKKYLEPLEQKKLSLLQKSALIGTMLGDATLQYDKGINPFYKFDQKAANEEYVLLLYSVFSDLVGTPPSPRRKEKRIHSYWFRTYRTKMFDFYAKQFYTIDHFQNRKKVVPTNIHRWLNPIVLAFWFMDNGSKDQTGGYLLHTENFSLPDVTKLQKALGSVFHLEVSIHVDNRPTGKLYRLYIVKKHVPLFNSLVSPYMVECMKYKLHI